MADDDSNPLIKGEQVNPQWTYQFFDLKPIEKGEFIAPGKIDSAAGREFAALNMLKADLDFALACLIASKARGRPDSDNIHSRALLFSAVTAYARPLQDWSAGA